MSEPHKDPILEDLSDDFYYSEIADLPVDITAEQIIEMAKHVNARASAEPEEVISTAIAVICLAHKVVAARARIEKRDGKFAPKPVKEASLKNSATVAKQPRG